MIEADIEIEAEPPENKCRMFIYNFATHPWFDMTINISIGINMIFLCMDY